MNFVLKVAKLPASGASTPQLPTSRGILKQVSANKSGNKRVAFVSSESEQSDTVIIITNIILYDYYLLNVITHETP